MTCKPLKIIDPHLHLFNLQQGDYHWLAPDNPPDWPDKHLIRNNFSQSDLNLANKFSLDSFVHIEAGFDNQQPWREIDWLEQHCSGKFKTVAFADITAKTFGKHLEHLSKRQSVTGIRYILDEQADEILTSKLTQQHFSLLGQAKFSFDAQLSLADEKATDALIKLAKKYTQVPIIVNHAGWPAKQGAAKEQGAWLRNLKKLAKSTNIAMKLSGWEMANRAWTPAHANIVIQNCINILGENRVMLASNFPLCLMTMPYQALWNTYAALPNISPTTFEKITYCNANHWYKMSLL